MPFLERRKKGFTLWEVMLATAIFALVVMSLAVTLIRVLDAAKVEQRETAVRLRLQSMLAEARATRLIPGRETLDPDAQGVVYEREIQLLRDLRNQREQPLPNLYSLTIRALWKSGTIEETNQAQVWVYQP